MSVYIIAYMTRLGEEISQNVIKNGIDFQSPGEALKKCDKMCQVIKVIRKWLHIITSIHATEKFFKY